MFWINRSALAPVPVAETGANAHRLISPTETFFGQSTKPLALKTQFTLRQIRQAKIFKNNQSDRHELADRINTTDWEGGTGPRTCSNDMHGHGVTMERHTMTIFYFALQIKHFKYSLSGQLVAIG